MEWVEKTGRSVVEAKERALDQLGVAEADAEVVVLAEPKSGLFGRVRGEARVRARVRPAEPRPKRPHRQSVRGRGARGSDEARSREPAARRPSEEAGGAPGAGPDPSDPSGSPARRRRRRGSGATRRSDARGPTGSPSGQEVVRLDDTGQPAATGGGPGRRDRGAKEESTVADGVSLQEQAEVAKEFIEGLLVRFGLEATVDVREVDESTVELAASGDGLGVLVGPRGATLTALQEVTRTVVQKRFPNRTDRILVDVAGYRERRVAALQRFTAQVAAEVLETGTERALEPMSAADRKVVHDAVVGIDGVTSSSEGEEPRRYVVISPTA